MTCNTQPRNSSRLKSVTVIVNEPSISLIHVPSQPIPIPIISRKIERDEEDEVVDTSYYDLKTWNMYILIVTARRLRASIQARDFIIAQTHREHQKLHHLMKEAGDTEQK